MTFADPRNIDVVLVSGPHFLDSKKVLARRAAAWFVAQRSFQVSLVSISSTLRTP